MKIKIKILFFAGMREAMGISTMDFVTDEAASCREILKRLVQSHPVLEKWVVSCGVAVNGDWAEPARITVDGDELALLPPVSGG